MAIILATSFYFGKYLSLQTILGIIVAMTGMWISNSFFIMNRVGVLSYNLVKLEEQKDKKNYAAQITPQESVDINYSKSVV